MRYKGDNYELDIYPVIRQKTYIVETIKVSRDQYLELNIGDTIEISLYEGWLGVKFPVYEEKHPHQKNPIPKITTIAKKGNPMP
jgi:hypothetical protein